MQPWKANRAITSRLTCPIGHYWEENSWQGDDLYPYPPFSSMYMEIYYIRNIHIPYLELKWSLYLCWFLYWCLLIPHFSDSSRKSQYLWDFFFLAQRRERCANTPWLLPQCGQNSLCPGANTTGLALCTFAQKLCVILHRRITWRFKEIPVGHVKIKVRSFLKTCIWKWSVRIKANYF